MPKSIREQIADKCVHFTGTRSDACKLGIRYDSVRDPSARPLHIPCIRGEVESGTCSSRRFPTEEEVEKEVARISDAAARFNAEMEAGRCPHCGKPSEPRQQRGRCIYAACGCRIGQGTLR